MEVPKQPVAKVAVMTLEQGLQQPWKLIRLNPKQCLIAFGAIALAGGLSLWLYYFSGQGNITVLKQKLIGELHLSTGNYPARSLEDLNQASWENGLAILEAITVLDTKINAASTAKPNAHKTTLTIKQAYQTLNHRLADRLTVEKTAKLLHAPGLYTPIYAEYLESTRAKYHQWLQLQDES